jgi:hypothetical protein
MLTELLRRTHLSAPSDLAAVVADPVRRIDASTTSMAHDTEETCLAVKQTTLPC